MNTRSTTMIAAGVLAAVLGATMVFLYARSVEGRARSGDAVTAYVATADIGAGTSWEDAAGSVEQREVPASLRPASAIGSPEAVVGRTAVRAIAAGEVVTATHFGASEHAPGGGLEIPPGHNAVSVNAAAPQGVARYVQPGDLVNVYVTFKGVEGTPPTTKLVLSNVQVLANRSASEATSKVGAEVGGEILLTLSLTPPDSEKLIFAKENGAVWFGLVHPGDAPAQTAGQRAGSVLS